MRIRRQLPVYSPLSAAAVGSAFRGLLREPRTAQDRMDRWLRNELASNAVLLTDSGTSALSLAIKGTVAGSRPRVALPAYGCYDLLSAADGAGAEVLLYDLDPETLGPEWHSFRRALAAPVDAAVVVHQYGIPVDMAQATAMAAEFGAGLIEDAAQAIGATYQGRPAGSFGSLSVLSFGRGKGVTGGGGGALLAHDDRGARIVQAGGEQLAPGHRGRRQALGLLAQWLLGRPALYWLPAALPFLNLGETRYRPAPEPRPIAPAAVAALAETLGLTSREIHARRATAKRWSHAVDTQSRLRPIRVGSNALPNYLRLPLLATGDGTIRALGGSRARALGIMPGYPKSLTDLEARVARVVNGSAPMPGSRRLARDLFTVPCHSRLSQRDLVRIESLLREAGLRPD